MTQVSTVSKELNSIQFISGVGYLQNLHYSVNREGELPKYDKKSLR